MTPKPQAADRLTAKAAGTDRKELTSEILEEYKIVMENAVALSNRRQTTNSVFVGINTVYLSGIAFLVVSSKLTSWTCVIASAAMSLAVLPVNLSWRRMLDTYGNLLGDHYAALQAMEEHFAFVANINSALSKRRATTDMERELTVYFSVLYFALTLVTGIVTYLTMSHVLPPV